MRFARPLSAVVLCAAITACEGRFVGIDDKLPVDPVDDLGSTYVHLQSDSGDWVGAGRTYQYTPANAAITVSASGRVLEVRVDGDEFWTGSFQVPSARTRIEPGTYTGLTRYPFNDPVKGGLSWSGDGRGCNTLTGYFTVESVRYVGDSLAAVGLAFEQHCEGVVPALRGTIYWDADDITVASGPVAPTPSGLRQRLAGARRSRAGSRSTA